MFLNKTVDQANLDLTNGKDLAYYLRLTEGWRDELPPLVVKQVAGLNVIDEAEMGLVGSKARFADFLLSQIQRTELVYCQPRCGWAGISLSYLAKKHGKKLTLFMPASRQASPHQLVCIEQGATPVFRRIAAMPNLNQLAKQYALAHQAYFIPFGLKHELVTAGAVRVVHDFFKDREHPKEMWTVISTGVLTRALQIALPTTEFVAVGVARNIQPGELGRAHFVSYHKAFTERADQLPAEFDSAENYDAKGFEYARQEASPGAWFWNVAGNIQPSRLTAQEVDSYRNWGETR